MPRKQKKLNDWMLLLPEMLLAAAQGKIPDEGVRVLLAEADMELEADQWPEDVLDYVDLGRILAERFGFGSGQNDQTGS